MCFFLSIFFVTKYYFSEKNIVFTNKSRSSYSSFSLDNKTDLPTLKDDTDDIVTYIDDLKDFKKKRKKRFWEKLISNNDE